MCYVFLDTGRDCVIPKGLGNIRFPNRRQIVCYAFNIDTNDFDGAVIVPYKIQLEIFLVEECKHNPVIVERNEYVLDSDVNTIQLVDKWSCSGFIELKCNGKVKDFIFYLKLCRGLVHVG